MTRPTTYKIHRIKRPRGYAGQYGHPDKKVTQEIHQAQVHDGPTSNPASWLIGVKIESHHK